MWLEHLSLILELFIRSSDELKEHNKVLASAVSKAAGGNAGDGGDLEKIPEE